MRPLRTAQLSVPAQHEPLPLPHPLPADRENLPAQPEGAARRPRNPRNVSEDDHITAVWRRADRGHCDVHDLVEKTRRAARSIRHADIASHVADERREAAARIEREMREARSKLVDLEHSIRDGKYAHRFRSKRIVHEPREPLRATSLSDGSDIVSSFSEDDGAEEEQYRNAVRHETDIIFAKLNDIENAVRVATEKVHSLVIHKSSDSSRSSKQSRGGKKKEQEAKRRERKERRRREQERLARGEAAQVAPQFVGGAHDLDIAI